MSRITLAEAEVFLWHPRSPGRDSRPMKSLSDSYLLNVIEICRSPSRDIGDNDRQRALDAALEVALSRGISTNRPAIQDGYRLAQIVQDIAIAFREEGLVETSPAAARVWAAYERELTRRNGDD